VTLYRGLFFNFKEKMMHKLLLLFALISSSLFAQKSYTVDFSDTAQVNQYFYSDSIIDPRGNWKVLSDSGTALGGVFFETDTAFVDSINSSCIIKLPLHSFIYSTIDYQTSFTFQDSTMSGVVDFSIDEGMNWRRVPSAMSNGSLNYLPVFPSFKSYIPASTNLSDSTIIGYRGYYFGTSSMRFGCYALKTDALDMLWLRFTVRKTDSIQGVNRWNFGDMNVLSPGGVCTSVNDIKSNLVKLYPVPASNSISFDASEIGMQAFRVSISDFQGKIVWNGHRKSNEKISISHLDSAIYHLLLEDIETGISAVKRFVKE